LDQAVDRQKNLVLRHNADLEFKDWKLLQNQTSDVTQSIVIADLDNDGDEDFMTCGNQEPVRIYENQLNRGNSISIRLIGQQTNRFGVGCRVRAINYGRKKQIQTRFVCQSSGFAASDGSVLNFGFGERESVDDLIIEWPTGQVQTLRNLKTNFHYEITEPKSAQFVSRGIRLDVESKLFAEESNQIRRFRTNELAFDDFRDQPLMPFGQSEQGPSMAWADVDQDGDYDLFVGGAAFEAAVVFENRGDMNFFERRLACFEDDRQHEDVGCVFFDFDRDSDQDLIVVSGGVESDDGSEKMQHRLYVNQGDGRFERANAEQFPDLRFSASTVNVADFNQDGLLDVFIGGRVVPGKFPQAPKSILLRNTGDGFAKDTELQCDEMVTSSVWSDIDRDGWPDLMLTTEFGPVVCFRNQKGKLENVTQSAGLAKRHGLFNAIAAGDIDNDGDTDFVVGNLGTNGCYSANVDRPLTLSFGPFGVDGSNQILETFTGTASSTQLLRSFYQLSNRVSLGEVQNDKTLSFSDVNSGALDKLKSKTILTKPLNYLVSGVLLNFSSEGNLAFTFRPLPTIAQASPIFGCELVDVNGDGFLDLYFVQNLTHTNPWIEKMSSGNGLLLFGRGDGEFDLPDQAIGLEVAGAGKSLSRMDLNDDGR
ncbi:MAG: FG-GAP-like repeat-containing protein, partial [Planctomycetota bacterium]